MHINEIDEKELKELPWIKIKNSVYQKVNYNYCCDVRQIDSI